MPKMKEIQKVVQKLSRAQESAAGGGGRRRTKRYKNIKSPPVYQGWYTGGDLITRHPIKDSVAMMHCRGSLASDYRLLHCGDEINHDLQWNHQGPNSIQWFILLSIRKRHPIARPQGWDMGMSVVSSKFNLCSPFLIAQLQVSFLYIEPCNKKTFIPLISASLESTQKTPHSSPTRVRYGDVCCEFKIQFMFSFPHCSAAGIFSLYWTL